MQIFPSRNDCLQSCAVLGPRKLSKTPKGILENFYSFDKSKTRLQTVTSKKCPKVVKQSVHLLILPVLLLLSFFFK